MTNTYEKMFSYFFLQNAMYMPLMAEHMMQARRLAGWIGGGGAWK